MITNGRSRSHSVPDRYAGADGLATSRPSGTVKELLTPNPCRERFYRPAAVALMPRAKTARDPSRRLSYVSCCGLHYSIKMGRSYPFESLPELEAMIILDADPMVSAFCSQPETFEWKVQSRRYEYTPDILVELLDGTREYREIKTEKRRKADPNLRGRRKWIQDECRSRGAGFAFWTREEIRAGSRLRNAKWLRACLSFLDEHSVVTVRHALSLEGVPTTLACLEQALGGDKRLLSTALGLVMVGELSTDLDVEIGPASVITWGMPR